MECVGYYKLPADLWDVTFVGNYAIAAVETLGMVIFDIGEPRRLDMISQCGETPMGATGIAIKGNFAYLAAADEGLKVINISDVSNPKLVSVLKTKGSVRNVKIYKDYAFLVTHEEVLFGSGDSELITVDISNPENPIIVDTLEIKAGSKKIQITGNYAYITYNCGNMLPEAGFSIYNIFNSRRIEFVGDYRSKMYAFDIEVSGKYAYLADSVYGMHIVQISEPHRPQIIKEIGLQTPGTACAVAVDGDKAYVSGISMGLYNINISDPWNPLINEIINLPGNIRKLATYNNFLYMASDMQELIIIQTN